MSRAHEVLTPSLSSIALTLTLPYPLSRHHSFSPTPARALISHLLNTTPSQRATARQALGSEWIRTSQVELEKLYQKVVLA